MTRIANSGNDTEIQKRGIWGVTMVDLDFASGHVYANDGLVDIAFGGNVYSALGQLGSINTITEDLQVIARPLQLTVSGVDASIVAKARDEVYQNRSVVVYLCLMNMDTGQMVANPEIVWEGRMDYLLINIEKQLGTITVNCEHRLRREPRIARFTDVDQQLAFPGDTLLSLLQFIPGAVGQWGETPVLFRGDGPGPKNNPRLPPL